MTVKKSAQKKRRKKRQDPRKHDSSFNRMFAHPALVEALVRSFCDPEIADLIDFTTLKSENSRPYNKKTNVALIGDLVFHVKLKNGEDLWMGILIEAQSSINEDMPLRIYHYTAGFLDMLRCNKCCKSNELPSVLAIVIYNDELLHSSGCAAMQWSFWGEYPGRFPTFKL